MLIGGGHSHVAVLRRFGMEPMPGVRVTLICRDVHTPYSGMLPGLIAGHYSYDEAHIDLDNLARFGGIRFIHEDVVGIDLAGRRVLFANRPPLSYDVVSINTGSTPTLDDVPGAQGRVTPVKPIHRFVARWNQLVERVLAARGQARIGVVGAGAGGVEVTLAMRFRLGAMLAEQGCEHRPEFFLFSGSANILPSHNRRVRKKFERVLAERNIRTRLGARISEVLDGAVRIGSEDVPLDEILWTTQASAASWPGESGLAVDKRGFIRVNETLESVSHPGVFAAGDVAAVDAYPREKAGVFAVRQGPPLAENLRRRLRNESLQPFHPQKKFLSLISTGDRYAVASRGSWSLEGAWVWRWKDWIDRRFMTLYGDLPAMEGAEEDSRSDAATAMHCAGCGSKIPAEALREALAGIEPLERDDVLVGVRDADDAAVIRPPEGKLLVETVDFFRAIVEDPYVFGRIAANHALSDLYAMGAQPHSALAIAVVCYGSARKTRGELAALLAGANEALREAGAALVGGHSSEGEETAFGLSATGFADPGRLLAKRGAMPGDVLLLTKPLGVGALFAARMRGLTKGRWIAAAVDSMLVSNRDAAAILSRHGATACTDVTGFGLLGHLIEILEASGVDAALDVSRLPALDGAAEVLAAGVESTLAPENRRFEASLAGTAPNGLLFDPQTAGGLLASVPAGQVRRCLDDLHKAGCAEATQIGRIVDRIGEGPSVKPA